MTTLVACFTPLNVHKKNVSLNASRHGQLFRVVENQSLTKLKITEALSEWKQQSKFNIIKRKRIDIAQNYVFIIDNSPWTNKRSSIMTCTVLIPT